MCYFPNYTELQCSLSPIGDGFMMSTCGIFINSTYKDIEFVEFTAKIIP